MPLSDEEIPRVTHALLRHETVFAAIQALRGCTRRAAVEGLTEVIYRSRTAREVVAALDALEACHDALVFDALISALDSPHASVRFAAIQELRRRKVTPIHDSMTRVLRTDESWMNRREALWTLAALTSEERWQVFEAATDPHWRVRHALIRVLLRCGGIEAQRRDIEERLAQFGDEVRVLGIREYLRHHWMETSEESTISLEGEDPRKSCPFWDWDAAVLARNLERMGEGGRRQAIEAMPFLMKHANERVRALTGKTLRDGGEVGHLAQVFRLLEDPRFDGATVIEKLLSDLDLDRSEELARFLEESHQSFSKLPAPARCVLARLSARWEHTDAERWLRGFLEDDDPTVQREALRGLNRLSVKRLDRDPLKRLSTSEHAALRVEVVTAALRHDDCRDLLETLADDPDARVRLRAAEGTDALLSRLATDDHPCIRAAALTPHRAAELVEDPSRDTSWHVLTKAARMAKVPFWKLEPLQPWRPASLAAPKLAPISLRTPVPVPMRLLGPDAIPIAPLGISGHYGLPVEGFVRAFECGVNLMFWEPNYGTMTRFFSQLSPIDRTAIHVTAGTFEAAGAGVQRDAERVLRTLKIERIALFLIFWVQSWDRITPDVRAALETLKEEGKVAAFGLSTHNRSLALEAIDAGWDPVMVRHNAAHRGAEKQVFPRAANRGTSLITFNATCYGRLLEPQGEGPPPDAADCLRYSMMQPGVRVCLSAPATMAQLEMNLATLRDPVLTEERREKLISFGDRLYRDETLFRKCVRLV